MYVSVTGSCLKQMLVHICGSSTYYTVYHFMGGLYMSFILYTTSSIQYTIRTVSNDKSQYRISLNAKQLVGTKSNRKRLVENMSKNKSKDHVNVTYTAFVVI